MFNFKLNFYFLFIPLFFSVSIDTVAAEKKVIKRVHFEAVDGPGFGGNYIRIQRNGKEIAQVCRGEDFDFLLRTAKSLNLNYGFQWSLYRDHPLLPEYSVKVTSKEGEIIGILPKEENPSVVGFPCGDAPEAARSARIVRLFFSELTEAMVEYKESYSSSKQEKPKPSQTVSGAAEQPPAVQPESVVEDAPQTTEAR